MRLSVACLRFCLVATAATVLMSYPVVTASADDAEPAAQPAKRLHTVPEDGFSQEVNIKLTPKIERILQSREDEDLVICVGGCAEHRDIVVYAQPSNKAHKTNVVPKPKSEDDDEWSTPNAAATPSSEAAPAAAAAAAPESEPAADASTADASEKVAEPDTSKEASAPVDDAANGKEVGRMEPTSAADEMAPPL